MVVLVLVVAIGGFFQGTIRQAASLIGLVAGSWAVVWTAQWVGLHWQGARPALVFGGLRWLVALLAGLALASLLQWLGNRMAEVFKGTPLGWLDRFGGLAIGACVGLLTAGAALVAMTILHWPPEVTAAARGSRFGDPALRGAQRVCVLGERVIPGSSWLARRIEAARRVKHPVSNL